MCWKLCRDIGNIMSSVRRRCMRVGTSRLQVRDVRNTSKCLSVVGRFDQNWIADLLFSFTAGTLYPLPHDCGWKNYENSKFSIGFTVFSINNNTKNEVKENLCGHARSLRLRSCSSKDFFLYSGGCMLSLVDSFRLVDSRRSHPDVIKDFLVSCTMRSRLVGTGSISSPSGFLLNERRAGRELCRFSLGRQIKMMA